jgi:hypothetical protein
MSNLHWCHKAFKFLVILLFSLRILKNKAGFAKLSYKSFLPSILFSKNANSTKKLRHMDGFNKS